MKIEIELRYFYRNNVALSLLIVAKGNK